MANKATKTSGKTSAGINSNVSKKLTNSIRADYMASSERLMNQLLAYKKGKRVMVAIPNPVKQEKQNKPFIRVPASTVWRDYKSSL